MLLFFYIKRLFGGPDSCHEMGFRLYIFEPCLLESEINIIINIVTSISLTIHAQDLLARLTVSETATLSALVVIYFAISELISKFFIKPIANRFLFCHYIGIELKR